MSLIFPASALPPIAPAEDAPHPTSKAALAVAGMLVGLPRIAGNLSITRAH
jgi:hypothetical protein